MANSSAESSRAFHLADAGLARFLGESFGPPVLERAYDMGGARVTVTAVRIAAIGDTADVYLIRSTAEIADPRMPHLVSRRSVQQYASLRKRPFDPVASLVLGATAPRTRDVVIDGRDQCLSGGNAVRGVAAAGAGDFGGTINGSPATTVMSYASLMAAVGLDWGTLTDPTTPFDYESPAGSWPDFLGTIAADVYPTIRVQGNLNARLQHSGHGLLVVTGDVQFDDGFVWRGVIIAGGMPASTHARFIVDGALLTGFAGQSSGVDLREGTIRYDSCEVLRAARGIAVFSPMVATWWEPSN